MQPKKSIILISLILLLAFVFAGCTQTPEPAAPADSGSDTQAVEAPAAEAPAAEEAPAASSEGLVIAGVVFQSDTFMQTVQNGMQAAADEAGVELVLGNTENDLAKESSMIDDYITRGVDAIVITPISSDGSVAALKKAKEAGITIICFNTCVSEDGIADSFLVTKNEDLGSTTGKATVKFIEEQLGGNAKIGLLNCDQFEGCPPRKEGFLAEVTQLPGVEIVADQAGWVADDALPVAEAMLEANPDINLLWAANEGGTVAHALAVQSSGLAGKVFVVGTDMNNQMAQMLQADDNILQGVTGQAPFQMGYDALKTALSVLGGESVTALQNTPTIYFGRGDDEMINRFVETEGNAVFEVPGESMEEAPAAGSDGGLVIAGVVFQSDTFMQTVQNGIQAAADEAGAELILGNTENDLAKESSMIDDYITRGVDAIVITPISSDGSVAALKKAKEAGIVVVCFNTCVSEDGIASAFLVTKNEDLGSTTGKAAVKFIEEKLGGNAVIGLLNCDQFEGCPPRKEGFLAEVTQLPGVEVVADQAGWVADDALPVAEAMLEANPTINLLWAANEGGTVAHALATKSSGLAGEVFVFGTDMNNQMAQMLQADDDILQGVTGQAPFQMGYDALNTTLAVLAGEDVAAVQNTPTIYFGRGDDEMINRFVETEGNAVFEVPEADMGSGAMAEEAMMSGKGLTVAGVVFQSDTFMQTVQNGMQAAADEAGSELILGNTENDLAKESSMIDDYITRGVDAILITPISSDGSVAALKKAKEAGITIICFNTCVSEEGIADSFLVTKNEDLGSTTGKAAVKLIEEKLGGNAVIGLLNCDQFEGCPPRKEGFLAEVTQLPGVEVVADQAGWVADDALPVAEAMLEANPTINLLWAANEGGTVAHALAVKSSGLAGEVFVVGTDMNNQMAQMLQADDDILQGVTGQAPFQMGYDTFTTMLKVLNGEAVEPVVNTPTIYFGRGDDEMINRFVETEGNAVFETK